ncbi:hypothetical protein BJV74DRAFT_552016 [Russula compacta]|nr:hypothetical protein BJV74DRAFT_552016 [Russula compacta]
MSESEFESAPAGTGSGSGSDACSRFTLSCAPKVFAKRDEASHIIDERRSISDRFSPFSFSSVEARPRLARITSDADGGGGTTYSRARPQCSVFFSPFVIIISIENMSDDDTGKVPTGSRFKRSFRTVGGSSSINCRNYYRSKYRRLRQDSAKRKYRKKKKKDPHLFGCATDMPNKITW